MAIVNSEQISGGVPIGGVGQGGAQDRQAYFRVTVPAGTTTTDSILFGYLPPHTRTTGDLYVKSDALGGATTLNIGDSGVGTAIAASANRYLAANAITTAGGVVNTMATAGVFFKNTTSQRLPIVGTFAAGTVATPGVIEVGISYLVEEPQQ
jgi:hypothetical protein